MTDHVHNSSDLDSACEILRASQRVLLATHVKPDGDAVGSLVGMASSLKLSGKQVIMLSADPIPHSALFLKGAKDIRIGSSPPSAFDPDAIVTVDCGSASQLGPIYTSNQDLFTSLPVINIDHHATTDAFGTINLVDTVAASSADVVFQVLTKCGLPIDSNIANALLFGVVTDSQGFRTTNTTAGTLEIASQLMRLGADIRHVNDAFFGDKPYSTVSLLGKILSRMNKKGPVAWSVVTQAMIDDSGASEDETNGAINHLMEISDVLVAVLLKETQNGTVRVSFRSDPSINIGAFAAKLNGGGHKQAAGATIDGPIELAEQALIPAVINYVEEHSATA